MSDKISSDISLCRLKKNECTREQKRMLMSLTFRGYSGLRRVWHDIDSENKRWYKITSHRVHLAYYQGKIIGWAVSFFVKRKKGPRAMFYVNKKFRRMGVGECLLKDVRELYKEDPFVFNSENVHFFVKMDMYSKILFY